MLVRIADEVLREYWIDISVASYNIDVYCCLFIFYSVSYRASANPQRARKCDVVLKLPMI